MSGLFLGKTVDGSEPFELKSTRLRTHGVVVGMTGSGKTGLCLVLLEELVRSGVPIIAIDPKGDLQNLGLVFPQLSAGEFSPWVSEGDDPAKVASRWKDGLAGWDLGPQQVAELSSKMDLTVFTPGSEAGVPIDLLGAFQRPKQSVLDDHEARRDLVADTVGGLLGLVGHRGDPLTDPAHVVLGRILDDAWSDGEDPTLETIILRLVDPPFEKVGVFGVERFFPPDDRMKLAMRFNGVAASPSFSPWTIGAPLDPDAMLSTGGKTKVNVFSIAHLSDDERLFFLSLLLGKLQAWSRSQPGTEKLRAVLFFDEVAGFLPPHPKNPPTKTPLLMLMKQARAVGFGVVLATQNPIDLDYKALSNAGLWAIGRLTTQQDRARLLKGLDAPGLDDTVAKLEKRSFVVHQVGRGEPAVIGSRHAMCYLRGPITRAEIGRLNAFHGTEVTEAKTTIPRARADAPTDDAVAVAPALTGVDQWFLDPRVAFSARMDGAFEEAAQPTRSDNKIVHAPALWADLALRFDEDRLGFVLDATERRVFFPLQDSLPEDALTVRLEPDDLSRDAPDGAMFDPLPEWMDESRELTALKKRIVDDVYRSETKGLFTCRPLKLYGRAGESREDFEARCAEAVEANIDVKVEKLETRYATKVRRLEDRIEKKKAKHAELEGVARSRQLEEVVNIGATIMSFFGGRKKSVNTALTKRRQSARAGQRVGQLEQDIGQLEDEIEAVAEELAEKVEQIREAEEADLDAIDTKEVRLEKADIRVDAFGILWVPITRRI